MGQNDFILDGMRWSFSSVNTYNTCPQAFRLGYLDALPKVNNAFSDWGTFMHSLMESYFRGKLEFFELSQEFILFEKRINAYDQRNKKIKQKINNRYCAFEQAADKSRKLAADPVGEVRCQRIDRFAEVLSEGTFGIDITWSIPFFKQRKIR